MSIKAVTLDNLSRAINKLKDYFLMIKDAVLTVNSAEPDEYGNVQIDRVNYAGDLESSFTQTSSGEFIQRTSGGEASIQSGDAWLARVFGKSVHVGFVAEVIDCTPHPIDPEAEDPITTTIDNDTFRAAVSESGTTTLTYTTEWSENPTTYGITVSGTPADGDTITVYYVKEERGTIYNSEPEAFVSTGWNLYEPANGYAKVVKYSDDYGYRVEGTYTAPLQFSTTPTGAKTDLEVTDGLFQVPGDGYVWVTDGDSSTTAIHLTWADWTEEANGGTWAGYTATTVNLSSVMASKFPYGLIQVETTRDEINISLGQAISRIERLEYSAANLATAKASGRAFTYDEENIYLVRSTPTTSAITLDGSYNANDHGIEYFTETQVETGADTIYGMNLKNKLERDVLTLSQQTLTAAQSVQVKTNIGIVYSSQAPANATAGMIWLKPKG